MGPAMLFSLNALAFLIMAWVISQRYHRRRRPEPHLENFLESFASAARYVRYTPGMQVILTRDFLFGLFIAAVPALVVVYVLMSKVLNLWMFLPVTALAGVSWTVSASELWIAGQRAMPDWARGRMNAVHIMASQGGVALGGVFWGGAATSLGLRLTLMGGALEHLRQLARMTKARRLGRSLAKVFLRLTVEFFSRPIVSAGAHKFPVPL
jgi:hypothetical protein